LHGSFFDYTKKLNMAQKEHHDILQHDIRQNDIKTNSVLAYNHFMTHAHISSELKKLWTDPLKTLQT